MDPCHNKFATLKKYHYHSPIWSHDITTLHLFEIYHYLPLQCIHQNFWTSFLLYALLRLVIGAPLLQRLFPLLTLAAMHDEVGACGSPLPLPCLLIPAVVHGEVWVGGSPLFLSIPSHFGQSKIGDLDTAIDILRLCSSSLHYRIHLHHWQARWPCLGGSPTYICLTTTESLSGAWIQDEVPFGLRGTIRWPNEVDLELFPFPDTHAIGGDGLGEGRERATVARG